MRYEPTAEDLAAMDKAKAECLAAERAEIAENRRILDLVKTMVSAAAYSDIEAAISDSGYTHHFTLETAPRGSLEPDEYAFGKMYVDQTTNGGYTGDDFGGTVSIPVGAGQFLQFYYSM